MLRHRLEMQISRSTANEDDQNIPDYCLETPLFHESNVVTARGEILDWA